jgi:putative phosphonate transport system ATP-binding protein
MQALNMDSEGGAGTYYLGCYQEGSANVFSVSPQQKKIIRNRLLGIVYQNPHRGLLMFLSSRANVAEKLIAAGNRSVASMMERTSGLRTYKSTGEPDQRTTGLFFRGYATTGSDRQSSSQ